MLDRKQIETLLRIQDVPVSASDETIRVVLQKARYTEAEIVTALDILRNNSKVSDSTQTKFNNFTRSESKLAPAEISSLLGIDITVSEISQERAESKRSLTTQTIIIGFFTVLFGIVGFVLSLYANQAGPFHPAATGFLF